MRLKLSKRRGREVRRGYLKARGETATPVNALKAATRNMPIILRKEEVFYPVPY